MKQRGPWLGGIGLLALVLGCAGEAAREAAPAKKPEGRVFAVTFQVMNNPFFPALNDGLKEVIEARGDELRTLDAQWDSTKQMNDISDMIQQQVVGIFINPVNWKSIRGSLQRARDKNIPCIVVDAPAEDADLAVCTVASDNVKAGQLAAEGTIEGSRPVMRDLVGRYPELNAVFAINDPSALGAVSALESAGKLPGVTIVTVDGSPQGIDAVKAGKLHSTSAQFPKEIGRIAAEKMYEHLQGQPVPKEVTVRVELITKENAEAFGEPQ